MPYSACKRATPLTSFTEMVNDSQQFRKFVTAVRTKPAMYFGVGGTDAIPHAVHYIVERVISLAPVRYRGPVSVFVAENGHVTAHFAGLRLSTLKPANVGHWTNDFHQARLWMIGAAVGFSEEFKIESSDGRRKATWRFTEKTGVRTNVSITQGEPAIRICFRPLATAAQGLTHEHFYSIAAMLKDLSLLRPGLAISLRADRLAGEISYFYQQGLRSLLSEEDYARWSLHRECISFTGEGDKMSVEGHLRFLHAGNPHVRSYVNFHPTQGGAHLEGLGMALQELFPDSARGCRVVSFVTNSNTGAQVKLPHSFIGALQLRFNDPRYDGPTKDILIGDDVREFVYRTAIAQLKQQWERLRKQRM